jgi:hypothetical protein
MKVKKIGWQKYESLLEEQMNSPLLAEVMNNLRNAYNLEPSGEEEDAVYKEESSEEEELLMPITPQMIKDINLLTTFDCWIGHTNFDITTEVCKKLDKVSGVEALKVYSRYRFFVGIGKMFDFKLVRSDIEKQLTKEQ